MFACEQIGDALGNVREHEYGLPRVWESAPARGTRQFIKDRRCHCTYECVMSANVLFNPRFYLAREMLRRRGTSRRPVAGREERT